MMELDQKPPNMDIHPDSEVYADDENIAAVVPDIVSDQQQSPQQLPLSSELFLSSVDRSNIER
jgi:hypothetical protein